MFFAVNFKSFVMTPSKSNDVIMFSEKDKSSTYSAII